LERYDILVEQMRSVIEALRRQADYWDDHPSGQVLRRYADEYEDRALRIERYEDGHRPNG